MVGHGDAAAPQAEGLFGQMSGQMTEWSNGWSNERGQKKRGQRSGQMSAQFGRGDVPAEAAGPRHLFGRMARR